MARDFDGTNDRIDFGSAAVLDDLIQISIACVMRSDPTDGNLYALITKGLNNWVFGIYGSNELNFQMQWTTRGNWETPAAATTAGAEHHVGVSYDGALATNDPVFYVDGAAVSTVEVGTPAGTRTSDAAASLFMGEFSDGSGDHDGILAEVGIWNAVLTAPEFASLGKRFSPLLVRPQDIVLYAPLLGNLSPEPDLINGLSGTLTGTTKVSHPRVFMPSRPKAFNA